MNYDYILTEKPLPGFFKPLAFVLLTTSLICGLCIKFVGLDRFIYLSSKDYRFWFLLGFILLIFSKPNIEDERSAAIQLQLFRFGFRLLVALIVLMELNASLFDNDKAYGMFFHYVTAILGLIAIVSEIFLRSNLADLAEKHRGIYNISSLMIMLVIVLISQWLW